MTTKENTIKEIAQACVEGATAATMRGTNPGAGCVVGATAKTVSSLLFKDNEAYGRHEYEKQQQNRFYTAYGNK